MVIKDNKVVTFHYQVNEPGKDVIENSHEFGPVVYLHGHKSMLTGLEEALVGKRTGDRFSITLPPEKAYGARREGENLRVSVKHVIGYDKKTKFTAGMPVQINTPQGPREVTVLKVGLKMLDIDTNHPLAGKTLNFNIEVMDVRDATDEEITHGHVHGEGGHHH